jgi:hypothetical protein
MVKMNPGTAVRRKTQRGPGHVTNAPRQVYLTHSIGAALSVDVLKNSLV